MVVAFIFIGTSNVRKRVWTFLEELQERKLIYVLRQYLGLSYSLVYLVWFIMQGPPSFVTTL